MGSTAVWTLGRPPQPAPTGRNHQTDLHTPWVAHDHIPAPSRHWARRLGAAVGLTAGVAATVAFAAMALLPAFGMRTMIVLSGSMAPAFHAGDALIVEHLEPGQVQVGDMIAFSGYGTDQLTTHRVIGLHEVNDRLHFRTQGDANPDPDANLAPAGGLHGRVRLVLPHAGRGLAALSGRNGRLFMLGLPALILVAGQLRALLASARASRAGAYRPGIVMAGVTVLAVATITGATLVHTMATFTDAHAAADNTFGTGTGFGTN